MAKNIKRIKIASVFINDKEIEFTYKKGKDIGKQGHLRSVSIKVADDCKDYAGKWIKMTVFSDPKHTTQQNAEYFKSQMEGQEKLIDVEEQSYVNKDGVDSIALQGKLLSKKEAEIAEQFIK